MKNKTQNELTYGRENACNLVVIRNGVACAPQSEHPEETEMGGGCDD